MADRLGDSRSKAYSLTGDIFVSTVCAPKTRFDSRRLSEKQLKLFLIRRTLTPNMLLDGISVTKNSIEGG